MMDVRLIFCRMSAFTVCVIISSDFTVKKNTVMNVENTMCSFDELDLDERLIRAISDLEYRKPTTVQQKVIPEALLGRDVMAGAPTGTGKSAAFLIPAIQHLLDFPRKRKTGARILILTPTRELAIQIGEAAVSLAKYTDLAVAYVIGGVGYEEQEKSFADGVDILVATPGRLMEYIRNHAFVGQTIEMLIIDEADRMLDLGFIDDVSAVSRAASKRKQTLLFSATLEGIGIEKFAMEVLKDPERILVDAPRSEKRKIPQYYYYADDVAHKNQLLLKLISDDKISKALIFVKTKEQLASLRSFLEANEVKCSYLRGEMEQEKRIRALEMFTKGETRFMIATDVASRGLDVPDISHVINYDLPFSADVYVHRIGRTARAGKKGIAINLVEAHDLMKVGKFERYTGEKIERRVMEGLRNKTRIAQFGTKKRSDKKDALKNKERKHKKVRTRDRLSKGKPRKFSSPQQQN